MTTGTSPGIEVLVRLFGVYRDFADSSVFRVEVPAEGRLADLVADLRARPGFGALPDRPVLALNLEYAALDTRLSPGDEVALIPPVAGG